MPGADEMSWCEWLVRGAVLRVELACSGQLLRIGNGRAAGLKRAKGAAAGGARAGAPTHLSRAMRRTQKALKNSGRISVLM